MFNVIYNKADYHLKGGVLLFLKKRVIRILPPYYLAMIFSIILISTIIGQRTGTHWDGSVKYGYQDVITHFLMVHDFLVSHLSTINHVFWSVAVEFRIYLFFPLLVYLWRKIGPAYTLLITVLLSYVMFNILLLLMSLKFDISLHNGVNPLIILFVVGMLAADYSFSKRIKKSWEEKLSWNVIFILTFIAFVYYSSVSYQPESNAYSFMNKLKGMLFGVPVFALLVAASKQRLGQPNYLQKMLSVKPLVFLGTFSYSLYLIHAPLLQVFTQYLIDPLSLTKPNSLWLLFLLCLTIIPVIAYGFFFLCEKPFMSYNQKHRIEQADHASSLQAVEIK